MFLLVKEIDDERIIIGTAQKRISAESSEKSGITVYEISDSEFNPDMIHAKIESFEEDV
jgi:hypothetical protein